jgi:hypothetical protein
MTPDTMAALSVEAQGEHLAVNDRGHRAVDHVAEILGLRQVDPLGFGGKPFHQ